MLCLSSLSITVFDIQKSMAPCALTSITSFHDGGSLGFADLCEFD